MAKKQQIVEVEVPNLKRVTISGSYFTANRDVIDFDNVSGLIPNVDDDLAAMHVRGRYAVMWIKAAKKKDGEPLYPERIDSMRQVFIDNIEEVDGDLTFVGKDIKQMSDAELQDLATAKDLRVIPLPKELSGVSLREARQTAYQQYGAIILGMNDSPMLNPDPARALPVEKRINPALEGYNFAALPPMIVDGELRRDNMKKLTNDEVLELEGRKRPINSTVKSTLTIDDLKALADEKSIPYHKDIGFDALHEKIFGGSQA